MLRSLTISGGTLTAIYYGGFIMFANIASAKMCKSVVWNPWSNLLESSATKYGVIVLNTAIDFRKIPNLLESLWSRAAVRVTVDGGTDRWLSWLSEHGYDLENMKPPHLVTGDMDSISKHVLQYYIATNKTTQVLHTPDQDETDFTKAIREVQHFLSERGLVIDCIFVVAETCGRFDQIIGNINTLFKARNIAPSLKIYQLSSDSITWLLQEGNNEIHIPLSLRENRDWCALIPIGNPCQVTTVGLKWNLNKGTLEFGKLVSTSNTYSEEPVVHVQTNNTVVWSMGIETLFKT